jgi:hypothetical protein
MFSLSHTNYRRHSLIYDDTPNQHEQNFFIATMKNLNKLQERSVSVLVKVEGIPSENTDNVRQALVMLLKSNPQIFDGKKSPQEVLHMLGFSLPKTEETSASQKGRWARMVERSKKIRMSPEATQIMEEARQQFREEFAFNHDLDETK